MQREASALPHPPAEEPQFVSPGNGHSPDFINLWMEYTENEWSPPLFRLWAGITMVAGALERRVWQVNAGKVMYPSIYTLLVAPPGVGKNIIGEVRELLGEVKELGTNLQAFHLASDSLTSASLVDELGAALCTRMGPNGLYESHSLFIAAEEFSVLCPSYDMGFISKLNSVWNCPSQHSETRRTGSVKKLFIAAPQINLLAGIQPSVMATMFPEEVWQTGIARRLLMIYSNDEVLQDLFAEHAKPPQMREELVRQLAQLSSLFGKMKWHPQAAEKISSWYSGGRKPEPTHSKLTHYNRSRQMSIIKLAMISACSARAELVIRESDIMRAMEWLFAAEALMPDIFREMVGKSDFQVMEELHMFVQQLWLQSKRPPGGVPKGPVYHFLAQRVPSDKTEKILELAVRANFLKRDELTDNFLPRPKHTHGVE